MAEIGQSESRRETGGSVAGAEPHPTASGPGGGLILGLSGISKSYPGVKALQDVSLACHAGEIHALVGENGSGKSTLVKIACGAVRPDSGAIEVDGVPLAGGSPLEARRHGVLAAFQDTALIPQLTVAENILLSFTGEPGFRGPARRSRAEALLAPFNLPLSVDASVESLSPALRQLLEVTRAMMHKPAVLLLDEPTAALDADAIRKLHALLFDAKAQGTAILYITHRLGEVRELADRVTVLRDGMMQGSYRSGDWSVDHIVGLMVGESVDLAFPDRPGVRTQAKQALATEALSGPRFGPVHLAVKEGEIVGIAGAEGNGQREFVRAIAGLIPSEGRVEIGDTSLSMRSPSVALGAGVSFQSGDRAAEALFAEMSVMSNSTLPAIEQFTNMAILRRSREQRAFLAVKERLGIVAASADQPVASLSGGNQQKSVLARALLHQTKVLIVDEPTQGVDARARTDIYRALRERADVGVGILVNSSDSLELAGLCDRVYVMSRGKIEAELSGDDLVESKIVQTFVAAKADLRTTPEDAVSFSGSRLRTALSRFLAKPWVPLVALALLIVLVSAYTEAHTSVFLGSFNLQSLFVLVIPLAIVAIGQQAALLTGGFDISVGAMMSVSVVLMSFWSTSGGFGANLAGIAAIVGIGCVVGLINGFVVRGLRVNPIIATIGMLGVLSGVALIKRPSPGGAISISLDNFFYKNVGFLPVAFIVIAVAAVLLQIALMRTGWGLRIRATGLSEQASHRVGVRVDAVKVGAFVACAGLAALAGVLLGAQTGDGDPSVGANFALLSISACVIGGASITGGQGSYVGAVLASVFLMLLENVTPLLNINSAYSQLAISVLTILAVVAFSLSQWAARARG